MYVDFNTMEDWVIGITAFVVFPIMCYFVFNEFHTMGFFINLIISFFASGLLGAFVIVPFVAFTVFILGILSFLVNIVFLNKGDNK